jgi:hypothetical protein
MGIFCSNASTEGEGRKTALGEAALGEAPRNRCRPASALCPDMARGENQMSTSTDNNADFLDIIWKRIAK